MWHRAAVQKLQIKGNSVCVPSDQAACLPFPRTPSKSGQRQNFQLHCYRYWARMGWAAPVEQLETASIMFRAAVGSAR